MNSVSSSPYRCDDGSVQIVSTAITHRARDRESRREHIEVLVLRRDGLGIFKKHWSVLLDQNDNPHSKMMPMMISGMVQGGQGGGVE